MILVEAVKRILYYIKRLETLLAAEIERAEAVENELKESASTAIVSGKQTQTSDEDGGANIYTFTDASGKTSEFTVKNGSKGDKGDTETITGRQTQTSDEDGGENVYTFTTSSGNESNFTVKNGSKGSKGDKGDKGDTGPTTTILTNQDYTVNSSGGNGFKVNNTSKPNSYAKLFADGESGTVELGSSGGTYAYHMDCYNDSTIRLYCFQRNPWKYMSDWVLTKDGDFKVKRFVESGTALAEKYQAKGSYAAATHKHTKSDITDFPASMPASDVYSWAKAATKPSYNASEVGAATASHTHTNFTSETKFSNGTYTDPASGVQCGAKVSGNFAAGTVYEGGNKLSDRYQAKGNYAATNHTHSYLPLSGGTMTGDVTFSSSNKRTIKIHDTRGYTDRSIDILNGTSVASIEPTTDLAVALSTSTSKRWKYVYAQYMYVSSGTAVTSDRNLKNTINDLDAEISKEFIMGLKPSSYKYNESESDRTHFGLIAQDVEETLKEIGLTTKDFAGLVIENEKSEDGNEENKTYALRYEEFIAPLIKTVQMQQKTIENLEERLSKLENQILDNK